MSAASCAWRELPGAKRQQATALQAPPVHQPSVPDRVMRESHGISSENRHIGPRQNADSAFVVATKDSRRNYRFRKRVATQLDSGFRRNDGPPKGGTTNGEAEKFGQPVCSHQQRNVVRGFRKGKLRDDGRSKTTSFSDLSVVVGKQSAAFPCDCCLETLNPSSLPALSP